MTENSLFLKVPSIQFSSVPQSSLTICDTMDCSTQGLPVPHQLPKFTQTHVHWVGDAIQPSCPLSPPSPLPQSFAESGSFPVSLLFTSGGQSIGASAFSISPSNKYSGLISFRVDGLDLLAVKGTLKSSPAPQFKSINSLVLSLLYGPTLISIHYYWKNHSFD